ncbi:MAG TPA: hypothetical protein VM123_02690 [archaeon]|nr:hypothetical protein [archaeon]
MFRYSSLAWVLALSIILSSSSVQGSGVTGEWTFDIAAGPGFTIAPQKASDLYKHSFVVTGDLIYMLNKHVGLIPASFAFRKYDFNQDNALVEETDLTQNVAGNPLTFPREASGWGLAYTPGLRIISGGERLIGFGQVGFGVYRYDEKLEVFNFGETKTSTDFAMLLCGGIEKPLTERTAFIGQACYNLVAASKENTSFLDVLGGLKYYF